MRVVLLSLFAVQALGAPVLESGAKPAALKSVKQEDYIREKRSSYGAPVYAQKPCSAPISIAPPSTYALNIPPHYGYNPQPAYPSYGLPQLPHYRSDDFEEDNEMMNFSEMNHMPMARYGYAPAQYGAPVGNFGQLLASGSAGGAVGLFPNANVGGCAVPLLLSCSPSVTHGQLVKTHQAHPQYAAAPVQPAYRGDEQHMVEPHQEEHHHHEGLQRHHEESQGLQTSQEQHNMAAQHDATQSSGMHS